MCNNRCIKKSFWLSGIVFVMCALIFGIAGIVFFEVGYVSTIEKNKSFGNQLNCMVDGHKVELGICKKNVVCYLGYVNLNIPDKKLKNLLFLVFVTRSSIFQTDEKLIKSYPLNSSIKCYYRLKDGKSEIVTHLESQWNGLSITGLVLMLLFVIFGIIFSIFGIIKFVLWCQTLKCEKV